jgi:putative intracellular protease/amidase
MLYWPDNRMNLQNVYIFLFDGYSDWEISYLIPELHKSEKINLRYFTSDGATTQSMGGLRVTPDLSLAEVNINDISVLVLPGGEAWEEKKNNAIDELVKDVYSTGNTIAAICAATGYLGQGGYLNKLRHTSNGMDYLKTVAPEYSGESYYVQQPAVTDKQIITATGIAPIDFAREVFLKVNLHNKAYIENWYQLFKNGIWSD